MLATPFDGPTVVITHHAPHWDSVHPKFRSDPVTGAFASDLSSLIIQHQPNLWVHGHVHNSSDYRVGTSRIVCNPHGYGNENPAFNGQFVVEVAAGPGPPATAASPRSAPISISPVCEFFHVD